MSGGVAISLDGALGDTHGLWDAFLEEAARRFRTITELDPAALPADRAEQAALLDGWAEAGIGDWRSLLARFAEERAPVYLRPSTRAGAALRALAAEDLRIGVFTDAPEELAQVALAQLGAARRVELVVCGADARERLLAALGPDARVAESEEDLVRMGAGGAQAAR